MIMNRNKFSLLVFTLYLFFIPLSIHAQIEKKLQFPITQYTLKNGLRVILSEDGYLPLVSVVIAYNVGSIYEKDGKPGLAYMLENLMFQGSRNVGRMQHINFIHRIGGEFNAMTTESKTFFYQTVPSNQLSLVLWLESDRMNSLDINASKVEQSKNTLIEEVIRRKELDPYLESSLYFDKLLFSDSDYSHPVIGEEEDIEKITVEDVKKFYSRYYTPDNAVICIIGDIEKNRTIELVKKYFKTIPNTKEVPNSPPLKPIKTKGMEINLENYLASLPGFYLGYRVSPPYSDDYYTLSIIEYILLRGKSSRLYNRLMKKDRTAFRLTGGIEEKKDLAVFKIFVLNNNELVKEISQKAIFSEINKLKSNLVSEKELKKAKNIFRRDYINQYSTPLNKALFLTDALLSGVDLDDLWDELNKFLSVKSTDIIGIANRYFTDERILLNIKLK